MKERCRFVRSRVLALTLSEGSPGTFSLKKIKMSGTGKCSLFTFLFFVVFSVVNVKTSWASFPVPDRLEASSDSVSVGEQVTISWVIHSGNYRYCEGYSLPNNPDFSVSQTKSPLGIDDSRVVTITSPGKNTFGLVCYCQSNATATGPCPKHFDVDVIGVSSTVGACGSANGTTIGDGGPTASALCTSGTASRVTARNDASGSWNGWLWTCGSTQCSANRASSGGGSTTIACGSNNGATFPGGGPPSDKNCTKGGAPDPAHSFGARMQNGYWVGWDWTCGSGDISCGATLSPGGCGSANGTTVSSAPSTPTELCRAGSPGGVSGTGPWTWTCTGTSCSAAKTGSATASCGPANGSTFATTEDADVKSYGKHCIKNGGPVPYANFAERKDANGTLTGWTWKCEDASCSSNKLGTGSGTTCAQSGGSCKTTCSSGETSIGSSDCLSNMTGKICCKNSSGTGTTIKIDGSCGSAARNYTKAETALSGSLCYTGIPDPINVGFPQDDAPVAWTCKGMTGGKDSATCTATRGNSATVPNACSLYTATGTLPEGYGSPFNQLSTTHEPTLTVSCGTNGSVATSESPTVATAGSQATYTYKTGFVAQNGAWQKVDFSGAPAANNDGWFQGSALSNIPSPTAGGTNFVIAFVCQYQGSAWKCGCRDSACTQNYWTIQGYGTSSRL